MGEIGFDNSAVFALYINSTASLLSHHKMYLVKNMTQPLVKSFLKIFLAACIHNTCTHTRGAITCLHPSFYFHTHTPQSPSQLLIYSQRTKAVVKNKTLSWLHGNIYAAEVGTQCRNNRRSHSVQRENEGHTTDVRQRKQTRPVITIVDIPLFHRG